METIVIYGLDSYVAGEVEALSDWLFSDGKLEIMKRLNSNLNDVPKSSSALVELKVR